AAAAACAGPAESPPPAPSRDAPEAASGAAQKDLREEYLALQEQAMEEVRAWQGPGRGADPRRVWAGRLADFAREHPGTAPAGEALLAVMQLHAARGDGPAFFAAYDEVLEAAPDAPGLQAAFPRITMMRMEEAGGAGIMNRGDLELKKRAYRRAVPRIAEDLDKALRATSNSATRAAAHYTLGLAHYQLETDPARALEHFHIVAEQHPTFSHAESARTYVRELETLAVGKPAPDFEITLADGSRATLSSFKGKIVLVDFWATWCQPCVDEMPSLRAAYQRYRKRGFVVLGISLDQDPATVRHFATLHRMDWPLAASGLGMGDPLVRHYSIQALPMSYLIDREGIIRGRALFGADVERAVGRLMAR
ncbi:MAG TPA: TlpA disulfide reductase family protein, partial [Candidatus Polarisedimenticolia bacterium]|nr:TlpA disulfide reductase family protein [Candidatus Polarisedimenticolia bacterium]